MKKIKILLVVLILAAESAFFLGAGLSRTWGSDPLQPGIASKVLRFHVIADSDSQRDQNLKLKVRDEVGLFMKTRLNNSKSIEETNRIAGECLPEIKEVAEKTLRKNGCRAEVRVRLKDREFPVKTYGPYTFPQGSYRALEVVIGSGSGHNWWCVLYPNMCFAGSMYQVDEKSGEKLREVLSPEEYEDVLRAGNYKVKFKLLEVLGF